VSEDNDVGAAAVKDEPTPAPVAGGKEPEPKPEPEPTPYEPPEDIGAFPEDEPAPALAKAAPAAAAPEPVPAPRYQPPVGPAQDPWGKPIEYTGEEAYAKGSKIVEEHIRERVGALAQTAGAVFQEQAKQIADLRAEIAAMKGAPVPLPKPFVQREHQAAAKFCTDKLREFGADPAWSNPKVKGYMEAGVRQYLRDAAAKAKKSGDMSDYQYLSRPGFLEGVFLTAKIEAGYKGGAVPTDVSNPEARLETVRSRGKADEAEDIEITNEEKAALKSAGISLTEYRKQKKAQMKWNKEI
jgi:hypothetical protein